MAADFNMIVDIVDERNRAIGVAKRNALFENNLGFRTVHVLLFDRNDKLVLQRLPENHPRNPNRLGSSVAGYLQSEESYLEAARRKLKQELGVTARIRHIGQVKMRDQKSSKFVGVFVGRLTQPPKFDRDEIDELVYMNRRPLEETIVRAPETFTPTFLLVYEHYALWRRTGGSRAEGPA